MKDAVIEGHKQRTSLGGKSDQLQMRLDLFEVFLSSDIDYKPQ